MKRTLLSLATMSLLLGVPAWAATDFKAQMAEAYALYKKGAYPKAIEELQKLAADRESQATVEYWIALCQSRLQNFDQAAMHFARATELGAKFEDLDYERGQALYAMQQLRLAREAFRKSIARGYKVGASYYYVGFSSQLLEDYPAAIAAYRSIQKLSDDEEKVKQAALLQIAEVRFAQAETITDASRKKTRVKLTVLPEFQKALDFDRKSQVGVQAKSRIVQIQQSMGIEISRMKNGTPIPERAYYLKAAQDVKYDTNVVTQADESLTQVSNKGSVVTRTNVFGRYESVLSRLWVLGPEVDFSYTYHANRTTPTVYQNDSVSVSPALRTRLEHMLGGAPASMLLDFEFNTTLRDYKQIHRMLFYSRYFNFILGERFRLLPGGSTTVQANLKLYANEDAGQNATDPGFAISQNIGLGEQSISLGFDMDYNRARASTNDRINYRLNATLARPDFYFGTTISLSMALTVIDTREQRSTRGIEKTLNPSVVLRKSFTDDVYANLSYAYTKNISQDKVNYAYSKHVFGISAGYQF